LIDRAGVEVGALRASNAIIAEVVRQYPNRFIGLATISPHDGMRGVRELVRPVKEHEFALFGYRHCATSFPPVIDATPRSMRNASSSTSPVRTYTNMN
jgi:predicted TIM-barrel fold metal-dependent hydrolase